jgi:5-methylcytosine-specific restriction endonuclease McrA
MPIIRSGYATQRRNGSPRAYRKARAQTLAEETACYFCGGPATYDDPFVAHHLTAHAYGGSNDRHNLRAAHATCNNKHGAFTL